MAEPRINYGLLTPEQWQSIARTLQPLHPVDEAYAPIQISWLMVEYKAAAALDPVTPSLKEHREQLEKLYASAFEFRSAFRKHLSRSSLLLGEEVSHASMEESEEIQRFFGMLLDKIIENTAKALHNETDFARLRSISSLRDGQKSVVRRKLWEPLLYLWSEYKGKPRFSEGGPLYQFIAAVQVAFGEDPPKPDTIKKVVRDWNANRGTKGGKTPT